MDDLKRRGRPANPERHEVVSVRLPPRLHDQACREAIKRGESVSAVVRDALERFVRTPQISRS